MNLRHGIHSVTKLVETFAPLQALEAGAARVNASLLWTEERGTKRTGYQLSRWLTSPPEACFSTLPQAFYA
ncbi:hypothetical protein DSLASN_34750 [Desulfoluna limicola]|uniref:Uncharacterized protein n=1 Tax=Desulfoluna limicola TaxID=2810562 RepID=A0ABN6FAI9_9BACT|nr:hypothetical protein DSLASN_34750 [Desulfoluna limicola]